MKRDSCVAARARLLVHLVCSKQQLLGDREAHRIGSHEVHNQFKSAGLQDRYLAGAGTTQNLVDRSNCAAHQFSIDGCIRQERARRCEEGGPIKIDDRGNTFVRGKLRNDRHRLRRNIGCQHQALGLPGLDLSERSLHLIGVRGLYDVNLQVERAGAVRNAVGIRCGAFSGNMKVSFQAARSIG